MKTIKGDLIKLAEDGMFDVIVHGANCFHTQSSGLAKQLATKYPQVLEADKCTTYGVKSKLGNWTEAIVHAGENVFLVFNAYTQYKWSRGSDVFEYDAFQKFLDLFGKCIKKSVYTTAEYPFEPKRLNIGFPQIGAGLAGGDWSRISKMIEKFSEDVASHADVTVVEYQP